MIAGLELTEHRGGDRGHAARRGARRFGAFEQRHALFEHGDGRIGETRVDEPGLFVLEAPLGLLHGFVYEALGEKQSLGGLAESRAQNASVNQLGGGATALGAFLCSTHRLPHILSGGRARAGRRRQRQKVVVGCCAPAF